MYADQIDEAAARQQQMIDNALANRPVPQMTFTGECHWCEESINSGHFCDAECRDDHAKMIWAESQRRAG
ncbi:hypothetical protein LU604_06945 [Erwinia tracheiphila]|uniref:DUF2116 family Zn-ribbon domain-containing protein n=1 Tax=Erwinia tracheiphila TaxID=65700 RepID=A0A345CZD2_9GAMM|nr:hypothetical protein [Erwinia tracheiphila]AXF78799.1 hypothetical protein AV903_12360 [Erwinia tracheiphila]UIA84670.1 hypothetical protein LU604_06945 [Erwinia tracheiphila]UIA93262.1 hypothetical protein LU632_06920 [Erwinia tracheiphila]